MIILSRYKIQKESDNIIKMVNVSSAFCDICGEKMKVRDSRLRRLLDADGTEYWLRYRRLCCKKCRKVHSEFPDFVMPGKHYTAYVILEQFFSVFTGQSSGVCFAENSTIRKWMVEINCYVWMILSWLWESFLKKEIGKKINITIRLLEVLLDNSLNIEHYRRFVGWLYVLKPNIHFILTL